MTDRTVGKCSICGGLVTCPSIWHGVIPPVPKCTKCGATAQQPELPVIPMVPRIPKVSQMNWPFTW